MNAIELKKQLIKLIQINKNNVFICDEDRKEFIKSRFNASSLKDMSIDELSLMLDFCKKKVSDIPLAKPMSSSQLFRIKELWEQKARDKSLKAFNLFIYNRTRKSIRNLTLSEAQKVLIALDKML